MSRGQGFCIHTGASSPLPSQSQSCQMGEAQCDLPPSRAPPWHATCHSAILWNPASSCPGGPHTYWSQTPGSCTLHSLASSVCKKHKAPPNRHGAALTALSGDGSHLSLYLTCPNRRLILSSFEFTDLCIPVYLLLSLLLQQNI